MKRKKIILIKLVMVWKKVYITEKHIYLNNTVNNLYKYLFFIKNYNKIEKFSFKK